MFFDFHRRKFYVLVYLYMLYFLQYESAKKTLRASSVNTLIHKHKTLGRTLQCLPFHNSIPSDLSSFLYLWLCGR
ncbi:hypothetical protein VNO80_16691 [Phaseolus coccineus]|uniref:Uncharacterized protein n=1 Tax=Phaseolus coccineus TaxID=3886 RepID=A0AAN9MMY4_PHACN